MQQKVKGRMSDIVLTNNPAGVVIDLTLPAETRVQLIKQGARRAVTAQYRIIGTDEWITPAEYFKKVLLKKMYGD